MSDDPGLANICRLRDEKVREIAQLQAYVEGLNLAIRIVSADTTPIELGTQNDPPTCCDCGGPRSPTSGQRCYDCYRKLLSDRRTTHRAATPSPVGGR